ncbi:helix-turn-helix domain-containing protein [Streptomyces sp. 8N706]|uniref:helix-turn-helix domain-containing protein n=1 Tax=Streptomyces sp. 8N706 TaxID=3457416 RepID=UPI003FD1B271
MVRAHPNRDIAISKERKGLTFYGTDEQPNAFAMDSLEFLFIVAQYYRGNLPLRLILILIANQRAGGRIELTQERMADILDVHRSRVSEVLQELMEQGIVVKMERGVYRVNPVYSFRGAEFVRNQNGKIEYTEVSQRDVLDELTNSNMPELVRYPSLQALEEAIAEDRKMRAERRAARAKERAQRAVGNPNQTKIELDIDSEE